MLCGTSSTGKSTASELLKKELPNYTFISESTRTVKSYGLEINEEGGEATQLAIACFHLEALLSEDNLILDRGFLDLIVYSRLLPNLNPDVLAYIEDMWRRIAPQYTKICYFPIEFRSTDDGVRSLSDAWREEVDREFRRELRRVDVEYMTVRGSKEERVTKIKNYIMNKEEVLEEEVVVEDPFLSLYDFLGYAAGLVRGREVLLAAQVQGVSYRTRQVSTKTYKGPVTLYPKSFLNQYFNTTK